MERPRHPRAIIDRRKLGAALAAVAAERADSAAQRGKVLDVLKTALAEGRAEIRARLESPAPVPVGADVGEPGAR
ncbi:MAG: hypothetical protein IRY94_16365, partial [Rhodospirillaceae bacterium]|nr:hypothetical protein [Rhodospirillaceae bacterium]